MGKIVNNPLISTFSGQVGDDIIFRRIGNRTFVAKKGVNTKPATPAQRGGRDLFATAQFYASEMLENPEKNQWYSIVAKVNGDVRRTRCRRERLHVKARDRYY